MPLLEITTSNDLFETVREKILRDASAVVATTLGKSEASVMVTLRSATGLFGGDAGPCAFLELRSVGGLDPDTSTRVAERLCTLLEAEADVPSERIYLNFHRVNGSEWGWNGRLLG